GCRCAGGSWRSAWRSARTAGAWPRETGMAFSSFGIWRPGRRPSPCASTERGGVTSVAFSSEGHRLVSAAHDGTVRVWDGRPWQEGEPGQALFTLRGHTNGVNSVAFHPREQRLVSGDSDGVVKIWETGTGKELRTLRAHPQMVRAVAFSPDGKWLATAAMKDQTVKLWDAATGQHVRSLQGPTKSFLCLAFSPDGARLAAAGFAEWTIDVWDVKT